LSLMIQRKQSLEWRSIPKCISFGGLLSVSDVSKESTYIISPGRRPLIIINHNSGRWIDRAGGAAKTFYDFFTRFVIDMVIDTLPTTECVGKPNLVWDTMMHKGCFRQSYQFFAAFMARSRFFRSRAFKARDNEAVMRGLGMEFANSPNHLKATS
jgi:hypothetical protein